MATEGSYSLAEEKATMISGPILPPKELYRWARMSVSVGLQVSVQTTTDSPPALVALSEPYWALIVFVLTVPTIWGPSDINHLPSRASSEGRRLRREGEGRRSREKNGNMIASS